MLSFLYHNVLVGFLRRVWIVHIRRTERVKFECGAGIFSLSFFTSDQEATFGCDPFALHRITIPDDLLQNKIRLYLRAVILNFGFLSTLVLDFTE